MLFIVPAIKTYVTSERVIMEQLIVDESVKITEFISRPMNQLYTVASFVERHNGYLDSFDELATTIVEDKYTRNITIAPKGVISCVYPDSEENQGFIGLDYFSNSSQGNQEAALAMQSRQILMAGPYTTVTGEEVISGFLPVFLNTQEGGEEFWGIVSITLEYPEVFESSSTDGLKEQGIFYELWRDNMDTGERQVIFANGEIRPQDGYFDKELNIINADWYIRVSPFYKWYHYKETWGYLILALIISGLLTSMIQKNNALNQAKQKLEFMVHHDLLTNLLNRQGLFFKLTELIERKAHFQVCYMDINDFKLVNDRYGHAAGDFVLAEFARRINKHIGADQTFARMSGDEFVVVNVLKTSNTYKIDEFWRKVYQEFEESIICLEETKIYVSFSRGIATYPTDSEVLDTVIYMADERMYIEKVQQKKEMSINGKTRTNI